MKLTIAREALQQGLAAVAGVVPTRTSLPVLTDVLLEAEGEGLVLTASDLDTAITVRVPADVERPGALTAPARKLQEIVRELPPAPVTLTAEGGALTLVCARARFRLHGLPKEEYPTPPTVDAATHRWTMTGAELRQLIAHVAFAVSTEETRPVLGGVFWQLRPGEMRMVATNGHRLARMVVARAGLEEGLELIVPPKALRQVERLLAQVETVEVARSGNYLRFRGDGIEVATRLIDGQYPNVDSVLPRDNDKELVGERAALLAAVRRMAVVAADQTHRIRLSLGGPVLRLSVQTPDLGEASEEVPVEYRGDPLEIGFNATYLVELLQVMPTEEVKMTFKSPERPATVEPVGNEDTPELLGLVMPLRLLD